MFDITSKPLFNRHMSTDENFTPPTAEEKARLTEKWANHDKKQKREIIWQTLAGVSAVFGLVTLAAFSNNASDDKLPECPADLDAAEIATDAADLAQKDNNTITLRDGTTCVMTFNGP